MEITHPGSCRSSPTGLDTRQPILSSSICDGATYECHLPAAHVDPIQVSIAARRWKPLEWPVPSEAYRRALEEDMSLVCV